ncbi:MAG: hypothetical protein HY033_06825 [Ignavibacteriae bacterium]|nr:hypothetical protein [Ignavibacteria bacterium]MBI3364605.1 hypothetical protein [Ignavibacteriota bacterium]
MDVSRYYHRWKEGSWISYGTWLAHPRQPKFFEGPRILVREITDRGKHVIHATFTEERFINYKTILNIKLNDKTLEAGYKYFYFPGVLNSSLITFYFLKSSNKIVTHTFPRISILDMKRFPIRTINFGDAADKARHDRIVALVGQTLKAKEKHAAATTEAEKNRLDIQIESLDRQIVNAVYELTEEERRIVEGK